MGFEIELTRQFVTYEGDPYEIWICRVAGAEAYDDVVGQTPGDALRAMRREFDREWPEARGHWEPEDDIRDIMADAEPLPQPDHESE